MQSVSFIHFCLKQFTFHCSMISCCIWDAINHLGSLGVDDVLVLERYLRFWKQLRRGLAQHMEFYTMIKVGQVVFSPSAEKWCSQQPLYPHWVLRCSQNSVVSLEGWFHFEASVVGYRTFSEWFNLCTDCISSCQCSGDCGFRVRGAVHHGVFLPVTATAASLCCCFGLKEADVIPRRRQPLFPFGMVCKQIPPLSIVRPLAHAFARDKDMRENDKLSSSVACRYLLLGFWVQVIKKGLPQGCASFQKQMEEQNLVYIKSQIIKSIGQKYFYN